MEYFSKIFSKILYGYSHNTQKMIYSLVKIALKFYKVKYARKNFVFLSQIFLQEGLSAFEKNNHNKIMACLLKLWMCQK